MRMQIVGLAAAILAAGSVGWAAFVAAQGGPPNKAEGAKAGGPAERGAPGPQTPEGEAEHAGGVQADSDKGAGEPSAPGAAATGAAQAKERGSGSKQAAKNPEQVYRTAREKVREAVRKAEKGDHTPQATKEVMKKVRQAMKEAREHMRKAGKGVPGEGPRALGKSRGKGPGHAKRMRAWMRIRRHMHHPRPTPGDIPPPVRAEMRRHAKRVAKLERIQALAKRQDDSKAAARAETLLETENQRHDRRLEKLFENAEPRSDGSETAEGETPGKKRPDERAKKERDKGRTEKAAGNAQGQRGSPDEAAHGKGRDQ